MKILSVKFSKANFKLDLNKISYPKIKLNNSLSKDTISFKSNKEQEKPLSIDLVCALKEVGMSEADIERLNKKGDYKKLKEAYELIIQGIEPSQSVKIALFENGYKRAQELIDLNVPIGDTTEEVFKLNEKRYSKAKQIFQLKGGLEASIITASLDDETFKIAIDLIKAGLDANCAFKYAILSTKIQDRLFYLLKKGVSSQEAVNICILEDSKYEFAINLINEGVSANDAYSCTTIPHIKHAFNALCSTFYGYDTFCASVIANTQIPDANDEKRNTIADIAKTFKNNCKSCEDLSKDLNDFITFNKFETLYKLAQYLKEIDFKAIEQIAPEIKNYNSSQLLAFIYWHFKNQTQIFNESTLTFNKDLTSYFKDNYVSANELNEILCAHPLTKREIGSIPNDWLDKTKDKNNATEKIYAAIAEFQKTLNKEKLAQDLSQALNKKVGIKKIGQGYWGAAYKISIKGAKDTCLKIFLNKKDPNKLNGSTIEPQAAIFVNENSDKFVKMYFGKVCNLNSNDGFLVTQYLDKNTIPENTGISNSKYYITTSDNREKNKINDIMIDFGWIFVEIE